MSAIKRRPLLFEYPALPKNEIRFYTVVTISAIIYAWYCVYNASLKWKFTVGHLASISQVPFIGPRFKDEVDWEWSRWSPIAQSYIPYMILNSLVFNIGERFLPNRLWILVYIGVSMWSTAMVYTLRLLLYSLAQGIFIFLCTHFCRSMLVVWISALPILYLVMNETKLLSDDPFLVLLFVSYNLLSYISFNLERVKGNARKEDTTMLDLLIRMLFYSFYQPYLISLIVLYTDFERQLTERKGIKRDWIDIGALALRITFWWVFVEGVLHFFYFGSMLHDVQFAAKLPKNEFVTLGMALCNFFHLKYVIIFGLPTIFARIDNMQPKEGPMCIARVAMISKVWRGFDRGLYEFFKVYIFVPICAPTFSLGRKIIGVLVSYTFVLLWHGFMHHNIIWIGLNIIELVIEFGAKSFYSIHEVKTWREDHLSDQNFRRVLAWLQIVPFAIGLYSNFYFLGGSQIGYMFVKRIFLEETVTVRWPFLLLITIGYNYMHVTMEAERWIGNRERQNLKATCPAKLK